MLEYYDGEVKIISMIDEGTEVTISLPLEKLFSREDISDQTLPSAPKKDEAYDIHPDLDKEPESKASLGSLFGQDG